MYILYNIILWLALPFVIGYHLYRSVSRGRRSAFAERFGLLATDRLSAVVGKETIWVHAVSVGETIAVKPLLKALKETFPDWKIVLSNVTETGRSIGEKLAEADLCIYFPFDYPFAVKGLLEKVNPSILIVMETEIWPNFLRIARRMGIPAVMVNGRISDRSFGRYLKFKRFFRPVLANFTAFCMQTGEDARRIAAIGAEPDRVHVTKNLKYDLPMASSSPEQRGELRKSYRIPGGALVFTAGSTHAGEEEIVVAAYKSLLSQGRDCFMILAPRHPERAGQVAEILKKAGVSFTIRSGLDARSEEFAPGEVLLVDTVGELTRLYSFSDVVFVGGSLVPTGGHNVLEPAACGVPVIFGPHMGNFREIAALFLKWGGGVQVKNGEELEVYLQALLADDERRAAMGKNGARLLLDNSGSTARHIEVIRKLVRSEE
ncbi:MAG: 3-deoxy-D-manno-octulosonic-acid [Geobacteraceae bacterium]|nr:MAG: 3-deoxy-D-manno-octulosonic-acid [Geobacteraceae bacterium]